MAGRKPKKRRRSFSPEFKADAVELVLGGATVAEVARDLGLPDSTIRSWVRRSRGTSKDAARDAGAPSCAITLDRAASRSLDLDPKREVALTVLLAGGSVSEAAAAAKVARETCSRWLNHDSGFQAALAERQQERRRTHERLIAGLVGEAAQTLQDVMGDASAPPSARVSAAKTVLGLALPRAIEVTAEVKASVVPNEQLSRDMDDFFASPRGRALVAEAERVNSDRGTQSD
ncbi:MAG: transposase [Planctomycetes bacterium]|nr:transposase [Planctomycetota bacterium]